MKKTSLIFAFLMLALVSSCNWRWKQQTCDKDQVCVHIVRLDKVVDDYVRTGNFSFMQRLSTDYANQTRILIENVLHIGAVDAPFANENLRTFYRDPVLMQLSADVRSKYKDLSWLEWQFSKALSTLSQQCPNFKIPHIYTQNSAFNQSIVVSDTLLGISLDKYMGKDYPLYRKYYHPGQYFTMEPTRILPDALSFYLFAQYPSKPKQSTLLSSMVYVGKIKWIVSQVLHLSLKDMLGQTEACHHWMEKNEAKVWRQMKDKHLLTSSDSITTSNVLFSAKGKPYFGDEYSRGAGLVIGSHIVESYMERHPDTTFGQLLTMNNETLYRKSGYNPE